MSANEASGLLYFLMLFVALPTVLAFVIRAVAEARGRRPGVWLTLGLIFSVLGTAVLGLLLLFLLLLLPNYAAEQAALRSAAEARDTQERAAIRLARMGGNSP